jgi:DNA helicase-2/ATP-dependent DNA helicase PcrA
MKILKTKRWQDIIARRWPFVICDEFQDTNDHQWEILRTLGQTARLLLLCDPKQMIYTFLAKEGVGPHRLQEASELAEEVVELETGSHRDPTCLIPKMADAIRQRRFDDVSVKEALREGRLSVLKSISDSDLATVIHRELDKLRMVGTRTIGIFGHSNEGVATLGTALVEAGIDHVLIGIPEAHAEALSALAALCAYGNGMVSREEARIALAIFLTACVRSKEAPPLAIALAKGQPLPPDFERGLKKLETALRKARGGSMADLIAVASEGWKAIRITSGLRPWRRACPEFAAIARPFMHSKVDQSHIKAITATLERRKPNSLIEMESKDKGKVQLMNFYQTKGREADAVLLVYRSDDYLANHSAREPFVEASRVLFVSMTRARNKVIVILPPDPHPLIAPFASLVP